MTSPSTADDADRGMGAGPTGGLAGPLAAGSILLAMALGGCAPAGPMPSVGSAPPPAEYAAILSGPLRAQLALPFPRQRAVMTARIRSDVLAASPAAVTPAFDRALAAIGRTRREEFVLPAGRALAYVDLPQQIGWEQTISQPYIVTIMTAALDLAPGAVVLDVGTGSGYQAAVLSALAARVYSIEIVDPLARSAAERLRRLGYRNVEVRSGDGFAGWPEHAPFDGIVVAAGAAEVPAPLLAQLKPGGRLVMPIGSNVAAEQILVITKRPDGSTTRCSLGPAMFVPLTGIGRTAEDFRRLRDRSIPLCHAAPIT